MGRRFRKRGGKKEREKRKKKSSSSHVAPSRKNNERQRDFLENAGLHWDFNRFLPLSPTRTDWSKLTKGQYERIDGKYVRVWRERDTKAHKFQARFTDLTGGWWPVTPPADPRCSSSSSMSMCDISRPPRSILVQGPLAIADVAANDVITSSSDDDSLSPRFAEPVEPPPPGEEGDAASGSVVSDDAGSSHKLLKRRAASYSSEHESQDEDAQEYSHMSQSEQFVEEDFESEEESPHSRSPSQSLACSQSAMQSYLQTYASAKARRVTLSQRSEVGSRSPLRDYAFGTMQKGERLLLYGPQQEHW